MKPFRSADDQDKGQRREGPTPGMGHQQLHFRPLRRFSLDRFAQLVDHRIESLKVLFEPFEDRLHSFICPLPIHVEVYAAF